MLSFYIFLDIRVDVSIDEKQPFLSKLIHSYLICDSFGSQFEFAVRILYVIRIGFDMGYTYPIHELEIRLVNLLSPVRNSLQ